jgi:chemotaxis family two-component system response regulator Rcp1
MYLILFYKREKMRPVEILWIEDNHTEIALIRQAMKSIKIPYRLNFVYDGIQALEFLQHQSAFIHEANPDLIMLDLNLPRKDGYEVLQEIKKTKKLKDLPVIIFSSEKEEVLKNKKLNTYFIPKPFDVGQFDRVVNFIEAFWLKELQLAGVDIRTTAERNKAV